MSTMRAAVFVEPGKIELQQRPIPDIGPTDALPHCLVKEEL